MLVAGAQEIPETTTYYVLYEDGSTGAIEASGEEAPRLAKPGEFVHEEEYRARLDALKEQRAVHVAGLLAGDEERTRGDFEALTGAGIPEGTARRLSGWEGPATGPE